MYTVCSICTLTCIGNYLSAKTCVYTDIVYVCVYGCVDMCVVQHVAAVLARKRQEEVQKAKKLQQVEEDRKMAEELHKQRLEREVHCTCIHL